MGVRVFKVRPPPTRHDDCEKKAIAAPRVLPRNKMRGRKIEKSSSLRLVIEISPVAQTSSGGEYAGVDYHPRGGCTFRRQAGNLAKGQRH
jgi:hypothetical protein